MKAQDRKPLVGLTGGIASGKSSVARVLRTLHVAVVDADQLAREVVAKGSPGLAEIVDAFGRDLLTDAGELDRPALGALVFADAEARQRLNAITHPRVATLSMERLAEAGRTETPYVVYEVPLLVETGMHAGMDANVVVALPAALQVERVMARDALTADAAQARIDSQYPLEKKVAIADYVVDNSGSLEALEQATGELHQQLLQRFRLRRGFE